MMMEWLLLIMVMFTTIMGRAKVQRGNGEKKRCLYTSWPPLARDDSTAKGGRGLHASIIRSWTRHSR